MSAPSRPRFLHECGPHEELFETSLTVLVGISPAPRPLYGMLFCKHHDVGHFTWRSERDRPLDEETWAFTGEFCRACFRVLTWRRIY